MDSLRETDFGDFEYKTYEELKYNKNYQIWLEGGGNSSFPNGETIDHMKKRCISAYNIILKYMENHNLKSSAVICHGGTIMAVGEYLKGDFYSWHITNGGALVVRVEDDFVCLKKMD